jgi:hypothetical protein
MYSKNIIFIIIYLLLFQIGFLLHSLRMYAVGFVSHSGQQQASKASGTYTGWELVLLSLGTLFHDVVWCQAVNVNCTSAKVEK